MNQRTILIKLIGDAKLLNSAVLNSLAHNDLKSLTIVKPFCDNSALFTLSWLTKLEMLNIPENLISSTGIYVCSSNF